jgi:maltooligosyltrehalose trehalohydrolase
MIRAATRLEESMMRRHRELPFGAEPKSGEVRFRLWAPRAETVSLQLGAAFPMAREPGGWFSLTTADAGPGSRYRYLIDGQALADPASRHQPEGVHGPSEVIDPATYDWSDVGWRGRPREELVLYELHLGTFSDTGDFAGAVQHLDHIVELGATAVELMPIAEFPGHRDWGYDGVFFFAPASQYGRPDELKRLVEACHAYGLAIFLDVVYNHFGPEGNYLPAVAPDFFTDRHQTPWGAAIDFSGPYSRPVRDFVINNALYWLEEFHFDGLRFDAVHAIFDDSEPDIISEIAQVIRRRISDREIHLVLENDRNQARYLRRVDGRVAGYDAQWNDDLHHILHVLVTGDTSGYYGDYAAEPAKHLGRALAEGFAYQGEPSPFRGGKPRGEPSGELPATAFVGFLQNHDQVGNHPFGTRIAARAEEAVLHAGVTIVLLSPQIPLLFMGEEWGSVQPFAFFCDFEPALRDSVREGRRREFAHFPEFQDEAAREQIPDPTALSTFVMSRLDWTEPGKELHSLWLARYRRMIAIRAHEIAPRLAGMPPFAGSYRALGPRAVSVEWRLGDASQLLLLANFSGEPIPVPGNCPVGRMVYSSAAAGAPLSASFYLIESEQNEVAPVSRRAPA